MDEIAALVERAGVADLVTFDGTRLTSTFLPVIWDRSSGGHGRLLGHLALANPQWNTALAGVPALAIVHGPGAYVSPSWYPSKAEHGRAVPTWNYTSVHFTGPVTFPRDPGWLRDVVTRLTDHHEQARDHPWRVEDAPAAYIEGHLRGIVGVEMAVTAVEAAKKLGQNRSRADRTGTVEGLRSAGDPHSEAVAALMARMDAAPEG